MKSWRIAGCLGATRQRRSIVIGVGELGERLHDKRTRERWDAFAWAASRSNEVQFWVIVPSQYVEAAKKRAAAWGVTVVGWGTGEVGKKGVGKPPADSPEIL